MSDWQPIESAPFEKIPLGSGGDFTTWTPWMLCARKRKAGWVTWVGIMSDGNWLGRDDTAACFDTEPPTHWMPLPNDPA